MMKIKVPEGAERRHQGTFYKRGVGNSAGKWFRYSDGEWYMSSKTDNVLKKSKRISSKKVIKQDMTGNKIGNKRNLTTRSKIPSIDRVYKVLLDCGQAMTRKQIADAAGVGVSSVYLAKQLLLENGDIKEVDMIDERGRKVKGVKA